jgi:tetratricopeptide (TPR) repeat protein
MIGLNALLTMIFFIRLMRTGKHLFIPLAVFSYSIALFSKETAILIPVLLLIYYLFKRKQEPLPFRHGILFLAGILPVTLLYFFLRMRVVNYTVSGQEFGWIPLINNLRVFPEFLAKFLLPQGLSPMPAFSASVTVTGLVFISVFLFILVRFRKSNEFSLLFGIAWFFIFTIPGVMYRHVYGSDAYDYLEHRAYLPMMGIVIFLHGMFNPVYLNEKKSYFPYIILSLIIVFTLYSYNYTKKYRDPGSFFDLAVTTNPSSAVAWYNRGCFWADMGEHQKAGESYQKALAIREDYAQAWLNMGVSAYLTGDKAQAALYYENATRFDSTLFQAWFNRATTAEDLGKSDEALRLFEKAKNIYPGYAPVYTSIGLIFMKNNQDSLAMINFSQSLQLDDNEVVALNNRGKLLYKAGMKAEACSDWQKAMASGNSEAMSLFGKYCQ